MADPTGNSLQKRSQRLLLGVFVVLSALVVSIIGGSWNSYASALGLSNDEYWAQQAYARAAREAGQPRRGCCSGKSRDASQPLLMAPSEGCCQTLLKATEDPIASVQ